MKPLKIEISGIGPHTKTVLDFSATPSPVALTGDVGSGKTHLAESMIFALYGRSLHYGHRGPYEMLTQGGTGEGYVFLHFEHDGKEYTATRTFKDTGKTKTQKALLHSLSDDRGLIAGPKVGDFDRAIESMLGPFEIAAATWCLGQNAAGDLCQMRAPGDRKRIFSQLLQLDRLDAEEKLAGDAARAAGDRTDELEAQLAGEPDYEVELVGEQQDRNVAMDDLEGNERPRLAALEKQLETARCALRDAQGGDDTLRAQIAAHETATREHDALFARGNAITQEIRALEARAAGLEQARQDEQAHYWLAQRRRELEAQRTRFEAWQAWARQHGEFEITLHQVQCRIKDLEKLPGVDAETEALAGQAEALRQQGIAAKTENDKIAERNNERAQRRQNANIWISKAKANIEQIESRLASKPVTPFGEQCSPCPLMKEYADLPRQLEDQRGILRDAEAILAAIEPDETTADLTDLRTRYNQAVDAGRAVEAARGQSETLKTLRSSLCDIELAIERHAAAKPEAADDPAAELRTVQGELDTLAGAAERVKTCEQAAEDLARKGTELKAAREALALATVRLAETAPAAESARKALADREAQRAGLIADIDSLERTVADAREAIDRLTSAVARHEANLDNLRRCQAESAAKRERARALREQEAAARDLRACFGARGVRQVLIDHAAPELEAIADDLFRRATGGRMSLRIATQTALADGSLAEDFAIMVRDGRGERDVLDYSGGERQIVQLLLRLAVSRWVARMNGTRIDCLVLDEPFTAMGETSEILDEFMGVLDFLRDEIGSVLTVTHIRALADRHRSQVRLRKGLSGVALEVVGAGEAA